MSYASGSREQGGEIHITESKAIDNTLTDIEVLYKVKKIQQRSTLWI